MEQKPNNQNDKPGLDIAAAITSEDIPHVYANGFAAFQSNADMGVVFQRNGKPDLVINISFTLAKTLAEKLSQMIMEFEDTTKTLIMTTDVVDEKIKHKKDTK